jgi:predicted molibdopterin-dependent oxidoreductase YjgC
MNANCVITPDEFRMSVKDIIESRKAMTKHIQHEIVVYEPEKCIKCGLCVEICSNNGEKYGLAFEGRGFDVSVNVPLGFGIKKGLSHTAVMCVQACPTAALSFRSNLKHVFRDDKHK